MISTAMSSATGGRAATPTLSGSVVDQGGSYVRREGDL
jgi:hypothetical protein